MSDRKYKNPQVNLRLPLEIKDRLTELAEANSRSLNAEMVAALEAWTEKNKHIQALDLATIASRLIELEHEVEMIKTRHGKDKKPT
ncbi:Arc family DNA-binding protein [Salmonella enterica]|uniref:partition protein ATPase n=1 Tax=Salmonella phage SEN22 TaxID=1647458 RepID=UPI0006CE43E9|nr:partition protein ATPase [Salmonella phage SEN22]EAA5284092.1 DNA-binding protein [Salmonella enterica subsp. houtenae]EBG7960337.1 Arc family DNA-binding protein [Salmonella enterica]ECI4532423.1 DNA-binding protein [Salmonella enterica subsp. diarizonae]EDX2009802.1 Arc family DNA-binding protein [Salmonella enterica subsp. enterica]EHB8800041.1 Arc family DNA-binding protein [Salmonella enterica subsp. enterica serovar Rough O:z4,z23:-]